MSESYEVDENGDLNIHDPWQTCADLFAENEHLTRFAAAVRSIAFRGDCEYCGVPDELLDLVEEVT